MVTSMLASSQMLSMLAILRSLSLDAHYFLSPLMVKVDEAQLSLN